MNVENLKKMNEKLKELSTCMTTAIDDIEERGKLRHREYSEIRSAAQEIKSVAQELRVEVLTQFKQQKDEK